MTSATRPLILATVDGQEDAVRAERVRAVRSGIAEWTPSAAPRRTRRRRRRGPSGRRRRRSRACRGAPDGRAARPRRRTHRDRHGGSSAPSRGYHRPTMTDETGRGLAAGVARPGADAGRPPDPIVGTDPRASASVASPIDKYLIPAGLFVLAWFVYALDQPTTGTANLDYFVPLADAFLHGRLGLTEAPSWLNEVVPGGNGLYYVVYPPMPALVSCPSVALFGPDFDQAWARSCSGPRTSSSCPGSSRGWAVAPVAERDPVARLRVRHDRVVFGPGRLVVAFRPCRRDVLHAAGDPGLPARRPDRRSSGCCSPRLSWPACRSPWPRRSSSRYLADRTIREETRRSDGLRPAGRRPTAVLEDPRRPPSGSSSSAGRWRCWPCSRSPRYLIYDWLRFGIGHRERLRADPRAAPGGPVPRTASSASSTSRASSMPCS